MNYKPCCQELLNGFVQERNNLLWPCTEELYDLNYSNTDQSCYDSWLSCVLSRDLEDHVVEKVLNKD